LSFGGNLGYRLHRGTISPLFADFSPLRMFKIVFRDSSLYPKQLSLFLSAMADQCKRWLYYQFL